MSNRVEAKGPMHWSATASTTDAPAVAAQARCIAHVMRSTAPGAAANVLLGAEKGLQRRMQESPRLANLAPEYVECMLAHEVSVLLKGHAVYEEVGGGCIATTCILGQALLQPCSAPLASPTCVTPLRSRPCCARYTLLQHQID